MRKIIGSGVVLLVIALIVLQVSSCTNGGNPYPTIVFRTSNTVVTYISKDTTLPRNTIFNVGINASKTGPEGMLKSFKITKSVNGGPDSIITAAELNTVYFSQFYSYQTGDSGTLEHYTFTVGNAVGLQTTIQFTDTVN